MRIERRHEAATALVACVKLFNIKKERKKAKLVHHGGDIYLYTAVEIPRPTPVESKSVIAVDVSEQYVYYGNAQWIGKMETPMEKAVRLRKLAERLAERRSTTTRRGERERSSQARIRQF